MMQFNPATGEMEDDGQIKIDPTIFSQTPQKKAEYYNSLLGQGHTDADIRTAFGGVPEDNADWVALRNLAGTPAKPVVGAVTQAATTSTPEVPTVTASPGTVTGALGQVDAPSVNPQQAAATTNPFLDKQVTAKDGTVYNYNDILSQIDTRLGEGKNMALGVKAGLQLGLPEDVIRSFPGMTDNDWATGNKMISSGAFDATAEGTGAQAAPVGSAKYAARMAMGLDAYGYPPEQVALMKANGTYVEPPTTGTGTYAATGAITQADAPAVPKFDPAALGLVPVYGSSGMDQSSGTGENATWTQGEQTGWGKDLPGRQLVQYDLDGKEIYRGDKGSGLFGNMSPGQIFGIGALGLTGVGLAANAGLLGALGSGGAATGAAAANGGFTAAEIAANAGASAMTDGALSTAASSLGGGALADAAATAITPAVQTAAEQSIMDQLATQFGKQFTLDAVGKNALKNAAIQLATTGHVDLGSLAKSALVSPITSGITNTVTSGMDPGLLKDITSGAVRSGTQAAIVGGNVVNNLLAGGVLGAANNLFPNGSKTISGAIDKAAGSVWDGIKGAVGSASDAVNGTMTYNYDPDLDRSDPNLDSNPNYNGSVQDYDYTATQEINPTDLRLADGAQTTPGGVAGAVLDPVTVTGTREAITDALLDPVEITGARDNPTDQRLANGTQTTPGGVAGAVLDPVEVTGTRDNPTDLRLANGTQTTPGGAVGAVLDPVTITGTRETPLTRTQLDGTTDTAGHADDALDIAKFNNAINLGVSVADAVNYATDPYSTPTDLRLAAGTQTLPGDPLTVTTTDSKKPSTSPAGGSSVSYNNAVSSSFNNAAKKLEFMDLPPDVLARIAFDPALMALLNGRSA